MEQESYLKWLKCYCKGGARYIMNAIVRDQKLFRISIHELCAQHIRKVVESKVQ